jgi:hypothetical protein
MAASHLASRYGFEVTGIDVDPEQPAHAKMAPGKFKQGAIDGRGQAKMITGSGVLPATACKPIHADARRNAADLDRLTQKL